MKQLNIFSQKNVYALFSTSLHTLLIYMGVICGATSAFAQTQFTIKETLLWETPKNPQTAQPFFKGAIGRNDRHLPTFQASIPLNQNSVLQVEVINMNYERCSNDLATRYASEIKNTPILEQEVAITRRKPMAHISVFPFRKNGANIERVTSFELRVTATPVANRLPPPPVIASVLANGDVYKIAVSDNGIHKLDYNFLKNTLGIANIDAIDPRNIQVLGNGGGIVPESNSADYPDDLKENAIMIEGENDGKFDASDYILFYAEGSYKWRLDVLDNLYKREGNPYDNKNYYFIKIANQPGKRIAATPRPSLSTADVSVTNYDAIKHFEKDNVNTLNEPDESGLGKGSGRLFVDGDFFKYTTSRNYSGFDFANINTASPVTVQLATAIKSIGATSNFTLKVNGAEVLSSYPQITTGQTLSVYASTNYKTGQFSTTTGNLNTQLNLNKGTSSAVGFLDYITMQARCNLHFNAGQFAFRDNLNRNANSVTYQFDNDFSATIWDVSNPSEPEIQELIHSNNTAIFGVNKLAGTQPREFIAHNGGYNTPEAIGKVTPQNLHGLATPDMIIIYHPTISKNAAEALAQHRRNFSNLKVETINIFDIYNEFSTGRQDISAIRNMARMFYNRADGDKFRYLLLFGDASYDYRNLKGVGGNVVPTYETSYSNDEISSYATDDYYGLLDMNEGGDISSGGLDIAIGRIPVVSADTALMVTNKIIRYDTNRQMLGDWINRALFLADDPDGGWNAHFEQANPIADSLLANVPRFNLDKIYADAYQQVNGAGGDRYPEVYDAIDNTMYKGTLIFNYAGHGGPEGFAQERICRKENLAHWSNDGAMPLCITASCSVGHFDDPQDLSIGEKMILQEYGAMIALFTTVRPVNAYDNKTLNTNVFKVLTNGQLDVTMGEALQRGKNIYNTGSNGRKFLMLGDPAQYLARPEYPIFTTKINGHTPVNGQFSDTLHALEQVTIEGEVRDTFGNTLTSFNGIVYPTIYDKKNTQYTLGNDPNAPIVPFLVQKNILFKGNATVVNGKFTFSFVVPQDINYQIGFGKISYYAKQNNSLLDAGGYDYRLKVGGTGVVAVRDNEPPVVKLFMNDDKFLSGGITNDKPLLIAQLSDDTGINSAGAGIGHDITAVLDENTENAKVLNDFFETEANSSRKGTVRYPLSKLSEGKHTITVKCWDVTNKSGSSKIEFNVEKQKEMTLAHVLNYPNPFSVQTSFQFEHNKPGVPLTAQIQIFTVSGKLVKTIDRNVVSNGFRVSDITWDATDDYGDRLANGVYVYRINVSYPNGTEGTTTLQGNWEKLVLFK